MEILFNYIADRLGAIVHGWAELLDALKYLDFDCFMYFMTYGGGFFAFLKGMIRAWR